MARFDNDNGFWDKIGSIWFPLWLISIIAMKVCEGSKYEALTAFIFWTVMLIAMPLGLFAGFCFGGVAVWYGIIGPFQEWGDKSFLNWLGELVICILLLIIGAGMLIACAIFIPDFYETYTELFKQAF